MVAAVSNAGGLGVLGAGSGIEAHARIHREIRADRQALRRQRPARPAERARERRELLKRGRRSQLSMGKSDWIAKAHAYGGKVIASVSSIHFASAPGSGRGRRDRGRARGAGHASDITTFVLILVELLKIR
jgi:enoyl-[acyl-carrier protein] reductase II